MFNKDVFKNRIQKIQTDMKAFSRGEMTSSIENQVIDELSNIYLTMADKYEEAVKSGSDFPAQPGVSKHPLEHRAFYAMEDLIERMELDFTQKFVNSFKHDVSNEVEIGKIQIAFLDSVRRSLHGARSH